MRCSALLQSGCLSLCDVLRTHLRTWPRDIAGGLLSPAGKAGTGMPGVEAALKAAEAGMLVASGVPDSCEPASMTCAQAELLRSSWQTARQAGPPTPVVFPGLVMQMVRCS